MKEKTQEAFPHANVPAALLFEQHLLSPDSQAFIHNFRDPSFSGPLWFPRAVDNIGHSIYPPYPGDDPATELFANSLAGYVHVIRPPKKGAISAFSY